MEDTLHKKEKATDNFRDHLATVDKQGKRNWIYAQKPHGKLYRLRTWLSYFIL